MPTLVVETVGPAEEENYQASLVLATVEAAIGPCAWRLSSTADQHCGAQRTQQLVRVDHGGQCDDPR
jgi:hypothetical protein